jgi:hypothetical protein
MSQDDPKPLRELLPFEPEDTIDENDPRFMWRTYNVRYILRGTERSVEESGVKIGGLAGDTTELRAERYLESLLGLDEPIGIRTPHGTLAFLPKDLLAILINEVQE